jgi:hypothetical protein
MTKFRSRLEARWAIVFDLHALMWCYEPEGMALDSGNYRPDFYLPELRTYVEVKPTETSIYHTHAEEIIDEGYEFLLLDSPNLEPKDYQLLMPSEDGANRDLTSVCWSCSEKYLRYENGGGEKRFFVACANNCHSDYLAIARGFQFHLDGLATFDQVMSYKKALRVRDSYSVMNKKAKCWEPS